MLTQKIKLNKTPQGMAWRTKWDPQRILSRGGFTHRLENGFVGLVVDAVPQRVIDGVIFPFACPDVL